MRKRIAEWPELTKCPTDSVFLLRFLRSQKFDVDKSMKVLERFIQMRDENPDWFKKLDPTDPHIAELVRHFYRNLISYGCLRELQMSFFSRSNRALSLSFQNVTPKVAELL